MREQEPKKQVNPDSISDWGPVFYDRIPYGGAPLIRDPEQ